MSSAQASDSVNQTSIAAIASRIGRALSSGARRWPCRRAATHAMPTKLPTASGASREPGMPSMKIIGTQSATASGRFRIARAVKRPATTMTSPASGRTAMTSPVTAPAASARATTGDTPRRRDPRT